jgi:RNA 3'-terminal phosphate cyclase
MIRLFVNGLAASAGGGLTYLRNVIPHLARRLDAETTVVLNPAVRQEFATFVLSKFQKAPGHSVVLFASRRRCRN